MAKINFITKNTLEYNVPEHTHEFWEIMFYVKGSGYLAFDDLTLNYSAGDLVLMPPNKSHSNTSQSGFMNINLTVCDWTTNISEPMIIRHAHNHELRELLEVYYRFFVSDSLSSREILASFSDTIIGIIMGMVGGNYSPTVIQLENIILTNFDNANFDLAAAIDNLEFSNNYIRDLFKKEKGLSPLGYLSNMRLNYANKLLLNAQTNHLKIYEIARMCGYNDQLYFTRVFSKKYGISPIQFKTNKT